MAKSTRMLVLVVVLMAMRDFTAVQAKVDFRCVFGPMLPVEDASGTVHRFCPTEMNPPFLPRGQYTSEARDRLGNCFECTCDEVVGGLACCETPCPVRTP